jgi:hypothetical protein
VIGGVAIPIDTDVFDSKGKSSTRRSFRNMFSLRKQKSSSPTAHVQIKLHPIGPFNYNK